MSGAVIDENDPLLAGPFANEMVRQMRAIDTYGSYDSWSTAKILAPFILTKEMKREIPVVGDPDETLIARLKAYYNALSATIEKEAGLMAVPVINLTHEGFGRAMIVVGKLVVVDKTLRDVHRFSFDSLEKMVTEADKVVSQAVTLIDRHRAAAEG
ncbi:NifX-associated nitrogen fixation protein [Ectothiorhodospiraceae bacterium BW-2]|nr:NifX-associated nitrogen fixation protein [Ectothiorhodospiraceae bacterium BW-2]